MQAALGGCRQVRLGRAGQPPGVRAQGSRCADAAHDVGRRPRRADPDDDVAGQGQCFDLALEDALVVVVVGDGREHRGVSGQRQRRQRPPVALEVAGQLARQMLGVSGTAAVAEGDDLPALGGSGDHVRGQLGDDGDECAPARGHHLEMLVEDGLKGCVGVGHGPIVRAPGRRASRQHDECGLRSRSWVTIVPRSPRTGRGRSGGVAVRHADPLVTLPDTDRQYHIDLAPGEVADYILLPGDPDRTDRIAAMLDGQPRRVTLHRQGVPHPAPGRTPALPGRSPEAPESRHHHPSAERRAAGRCRHRRRSGRDRGGRRRRS